jgi:pyruvate dehydrogenase E2 component (dihydrolipoamide acetyltransferase)
MTDFTLPELGENVETGDVLRVLVKPGDTLAKDQPVLELETDKATIEVPSTVAGKVQAVNVKAGDKVKVGQSILTVDDGGDQAASKPDREARKAEADQAGREESREESKEGKESPRESDAAAAPATKAAGKAAAKPRDVGPTEPQAEEQAEGRAREAGDADETSGARARAAAAPPGGGGGTDKVVAISRGTRVTADQEAPQSPAAPAAPSVRRIARELGVDIGQVAGSGQSGRISVDDVKAHVKRLVTGGAEPGATAIRPVPLPDFSAWGEVERRAMRAVRRKTAEHLSAAWAAIPHVTQHDRADVTALEEVRKQYAKQVEADGGKLTVTAIAVKIAGAGLKVFPQFNTSIDLAADEIVYKKYVNIGIAVDTDRGLLVPVVRDVDQKNIHRISIEIAELSEKARSRKISLDEMSGGCFSVSNLGGIGGTSFTPIVNAPEVAVLGISRARMEPVWDAAHNGFVPRLILPLSLSYDHRVIDGADGARFLRWVVEALEQPFLLALQA